MIDFSLFFKRVKYNQYIYSGNKISTKRFLITKEQKSEIIDLHVDYAYMAGGACSLVVPMFFFGRKVGLISIILALIYCHMIFKRKLKSILKDCVILYEKESLIKIYSTIGIKNSWYEFSKKIFGLCAGLTIGCLALQKCLHQFTMLVFIGIMIYLLVIVLCGLTLLIELIAKIHHVLTNRKKIPQITSNTK